MKGQINRNIIVRLLVPALTFNMAVSMPLSVKAADVQSLTPPVVATQIFSEAKVLTVIDTSILGWEVLRDSVEEGEVLLLQDDKQPLNAILNKLEEMKRIDTLNIISHGSSGELKFKDYEVAVAALENNQEIWRKLGTYLNEEADIQLFGCDIAKGEQGYIFTEKLAELTGADIAASINSTGAQEKGGDWTLEMSTGAIESQFPFIRNNLSNFSHLLAGGDTTFNFSGFSDEGGILNNEYYTISAEVDGVPQPISRTSLNKQCYINLNQTFENISIRIIPNNENFPSMKLNHVYITGYDGADVSTKIYGRRVKDDVYSGAQSRIEKGDKNKSVKYMYSSPDPMKSITIELSKRAGEADPIVKNFRLDSFMVTLLYAPTVSNVGMTGTVKVGEKLTGAYSYKDENGDSQGVSVFKWYRSDDAEGMHKTAILGAEGKTYVLTTDDLEKYISFEVTPVATKEPTTGVAVESNRVKVLEAKPPTASSVSISGTMQVGKILTGSYVYADENGDSQGISTFKWYRSDDAEGTTKMEILGAEGKTYVLTADDLEKYISFEVTPVATKEPTTGTAVESSRTSKVLAAEAPPTASSISISGTTQVGKTLTGSYSYEDVNGDEEGASTFKWYRSDDATGTNKTEITGATARTYTLTTADADQYISFEVTPIAVTGENIGLPSESKKISIDRFTHAEEPSIDEQPTGRTVNVGDTTSLSVIANGTGNLSYQWYSNTTNNNTGGTLINGATATSYLVPTDTAGSRYYYCRVINTDDTKTGNKKATAVTHVVQVIVKNLNLGTPTIHSVVAGDTQITISWQPVDGAEGYKIYRRTASSLYDAAIDNVEASVNSYTAEHLTNGTKYYFVVKAINGASESAASGEASGIPQAVAPGAPVIQSAVPGNGKVKLTWSAVSGAKYYKVYTGEASGSYNLPIIIYDLSSEATTDSVYSLNMKTTTDSIYSLDVTGLSNGTTYYFAVKATNLGGDGSYSNEISATPRTMPKAPRSPKAQAGNGQAVISFTAPEDDGGSPIIKYIVTSDPGNITVEGTGTTLTVTGLVNGKRYTFTVKAISAVGSSESSVMSNAVTPHASSSGNSSSGGGDSSASQTASDKSNNSLQENVVILVNGKAENAGIATASHRGEKTVLTIAVDEKKVEQKLAEEGNHAVVTIPVNTNAEIVVGELNGQMVKNMEAKAAIVELKTEMATYTLPAKQINIDDISSKIGSKVELKDIKVKIEIAKAGAETIKITENSARKGGFTIIVSPVDFTVTCTYDNKTIDITHFNAYIERTVALPEGIDPNKITTGVIIGPDGAVLHVPTQVVQSDGKYYAKINSLTNSTYSVIWHPITFKDVEHHWAKASVNDMGSRMVISGVGDDKFEPNRDITRAEFAAIMARALGLKSEEGKTSFKDVKITDWYASSIETAYKYGILSGYGGGEVGANDKITREQAMAMIANAMKITGLNTIVTEDEVVSVVGPYKDSSQSAEWAEKSIAKCIKSGIVLGKENNTLAPKAAITRAEVTTIIERLLQKSNLI